VTLIEFFSLVKPHFEDLRIIFDWCLSKPWYFTPIARHFSNVEGIDVLDRLTKMEVFFAHQSAKRTQNLISR
jgi:hypothetical protein